jgi:hypothetical protein
MMAEKIRTFRIEGDVKKEVKRLLDKHKWFWFMPPANGFGRSGISDILALRGGVFMAVETKFGKKKPSAMQVGFLQSIHIETGFAFVVSDLNMRWFAVWLEAFDASCAAVKVGGQPAPEDGAMMLDAIKQLTGDVL